MPIYDGKTFEELIELGYKPVEGAQIRRGSSWKHECASCHRWYGRLKQVSTGVAVCWRCFPAAAKSYRHA